MNVMEEVGQLLAEGGGHYKGCHIQPEFNAANHFYLLKCYRPVNYVSIFPDGEFVYGDGHLLSDRHPLRVEMPTAKKPSMAVMYACPNQMDGVATESKSKSAKAQTIVDPGSYGACTKYTVDVFRIGDDEIELATLAASGHELMPLRPAFNSHVTHYETHVELHSPFTISAAVRQTLGLVGIEYVGDGDGGLGNANGCSIASKKSMIWHLPGFNAAGYFKYKLCGYASDLHASKIYYLTVKSTPVYSAKLMTVTAGKYELKPPFDPKEQSYTIEINYDVREVPIAVESKDLKASIDFEFPGEEHNTTGRAKQRGKAFINVAMPDNSHLKKGQTPKWTRTVSAKLVSADGTSTMSYVFTVRQIVSTFDKLKDITIGEDTPCKLDPPFNENITEYSCIWWWENKHTHKEIKVGSVIPHMDVEGKCSKCQLLSVDYKSHPQAQLSYDSEEEERVPWKSAKKWYRKFLYGENHRIPFQVVSADKFTSTTYWVLMKRDCPLWMQTWFIRAVSHYATLLAGIMAISSVTNVMALAKQVQFMTLTCEIDGVPPVYKDFAESLKNFNFDAFDYLPFDKLGIPTVKDLKKWKKTQIEGMKTKLGVEHATLLLQYCNARRTFPHDLLIPNAVLERVPKDAQQLINNMRRHAEKERKHKEELRKEEAEEKAEEEKERKRQKALAALKALNPKVGDDGEKARERRRLSAFLASIDAEEPSANVSRGSANLSAFTDSG